MNCANHPEIAATAYCRTCGKPLCANCTRDVMGVIYCENCLAERLHGVQPPTPPPVAGFVSAVPGAPLREGPNPALAGILAGFFPFGLGAVYCGQYAKGLAHLVTFTLLVWGETVVDNGGLNAILGVGIAFFYVYQIIDAIRTAHAVRLGQPPPDPFGLARMFGATEAQPYAPSAGVAYVPNAGAASQPTENFAGERIPSSKVPTAAVVLIGLGCLFLLQTVGVFEFSVHRIWPLFLIGLGVWMFAVRWGAIGPRYRRDRNYGSYRTRGLVGPVALITVGVLTLIEHMNGPDWGRTWPILLLAIGITKLLEGRMPPPPGLSSTATGMGSTGIPVAEVQPPTASSSSSSSEVKNG